MKALGLLFLVLSISLFSCKKDEQSGGGSEVVILDTNGRVPDEYTDSPSPGCDVSQDEESQNPQKKFRPKIGDGHAQIKGKGPYRKFKYKDSYSDLLYEEIEDPDFNILFNTKLSKKQLKLASCPRFNNLNREDKKKFFTIYMATNIQGEGGHNELAYMDEKGTGDSYGLNMVDSPNCTRNAKALGSRKVYAGGNRKYSDGKDMYIPRKNIECGYVVLANQFRKGLGLFTSDSKLTPESKKSYWATMRYGRSAHAKMVKRLHQHMVQIPSCRTAPSNPKYGETKGTVKKVGNKCDAIANSSRDEFSNKRIDNQSQESFGMSNSSNTYNSISK